MDIETMLEHHNWANRCYLDYIGSLGPELYHVRMPGPDKSIHDLLHHLVIVFKGWLAEMEGGESDWSFPSDASVKELSDEIIDLQRKITDFATSRDIDREIILQYHEEHKPLSTSPRDMIFNFIVHSGYHRGQLAFILRYHGFEGIEETDFNPYIYDLAQQK